MKLPAKARYQVAAATTGYGKRNRFLPILYGMENEHVLSGLRRKRAEIAGRLEVAHVEISRLAGDLASVDATIRLFAPHADLDEISPKRPPVPGAAMPGEISRVVLAAFRTAPDGLSTRDVALAVMTARGIPTADGRLLEAMQKRVLASLRNLRIRGVVEAQKEHGRLLRWMLATKQGEPPPVDA